MCMDEALRSVSRREQKVEREVVLAITPHITSLYALLTHVKMVDLSPLLRTVQKSSQNIPIRTKMTFRMFNDSESSLGFLSLIELC